MTFYFPDPGGKTWTSSNQSRRPFSYAFGTENQSTEENKSISPRMVSNSSAGLYNPSFGAPQTNNASNTGATVSSSSNTNFGNKGAATKGPISMKTTSGNAMSNSSSKPLTSNTANIGVTQAYNTSPRNSLFSSNNQNSIFGGSGQNGIFGTGSSTARGPAHGDLPAYTSSWSPKGSRSSMDGGSGTRQNKAFW